MTTYQLSPAAEQDLDDIANYIAQDRPSAVAGVLDTLEAGCRLVATHPAIGRQRDEIGRGVMSFPVGDYLLFYATEDATVGIARILHSRRDVVPIFHDE